MARPWFFDVLHLDGVDLLERPLPARRSILQRVPGDLVIPWRVTSSAGEAHAVMDEALAAGHEGVVVKATTSPYAAGRRGKAWVKVNATSLKTYDLCQSQATGGWVKQVLNLTAYAGQQVSLQFGALTDASLPSNFFIDDVAFQAGTAAAEEPVPLEGLPAFRQ